MKAIALAKTENRKSSKRFVPSLNKFIIDIIRQNKTKQPSQPLSDFSVSFSSAKRASFHSESTISYHIISRSL